MLLLKYEKFSIVSKDSFLEELIFKYEKNIGHYQKFDKRGRIALNSMIALLNDDDINECFDEINVQYQELVDVKDKLTKLKENQEYVYQTLSEACNKKLQQSNANMNTLKEVYKIQKYFGELQQEMREDVLNKVQIIDKSLPKVIFECKDAQEGILLMIDLWTYHNNVELQTQ